MIGRDLAGIGLSALLLAAPVGAIVQAIAPAVASGRTDAEAGGKAAEAAGRALAKRQWAKAVPLAEAAVAYRPQDAGYRALLGQAYLRAGRFASADQAFSDAIAMQPASGAIALNLALARIGAGRWAAAQDILSAHAATIAPADRGLALALSGDPRAGVEVLTAAVRAPGADAKARQNLALALALSGMWAEARTMIGLDMDPAAADARVIEWARFAAPAKASDQVAALLGITPAVDPGQPTAIALARAVPATVPTVPTTAGAAVPAATVFGPRREVVQALSASPSAAPLIAAAPSAYKARVKVAAPARTARSGEWVVQIGAFGDAQDARAGWSRATRRMPALARLTPTGASAQVNGATYYRLAVGGFARADAVSLCERYRASGGGCFVRAPAGDRVAAWHRGGVQLASRQSLIH